VAIFRTCGVGGFRVINESDVFGVEWLGLTLLGILMRSVNL